MNFFHKGSTRSCIMGPRPGHILSLTLEGQAAAWRPEEHFSFYFVLYPCMKTGIFRPDIYSVFIGFFQSRQSSSNQGSGIQ